MNAALAWGTGALLALSAAAAQAAPEHSDAAVAEPLPALRARFMRRIDEEGFRVCAPPAIRAVEGPVPARYDATTDALAVGAAAAAADAATRWAFVHELGHWWQRAAARAARVHMPPQAALTGSRSPSGASRIRASQLPWWSRPAVTC